MATVSLPSLDADIYRGVQLTMSLLSYRVHVLNEFTLILGAVVHFTSFYRFLTKLQTLTAQIDIQTKIFITQAVFTLCKLSLLSKALVNCIRLQRVQNVNQNIRCLIFQLFMSST